MGVPNFDTHYDDLTDVESDPRFMRLCAQQTKALSKVTAKHARDRIRLAIAIKQERQVENEVSR